MPRITTPLTVKQIDNAKPKAKKYKLYDGGGLFLLVSPTGSKLWRLKYRFNHREREYAIGVYPRITLAEAREKREALKRLIHDGIDPNEKKRQSRKETVQKEELTAFEEKTQLHLVVEEWLELHDKKVTDYTARKTRALLGNNLLPHFSERTPKGRVIRSVPIGEIKHHQITDLLKEKAKETEYTAKRLKQFLGRIWLFAVTSGYCESNIVANISDEVLPAPKTKHISKITDEKLLGQMLRDIDAYTGSPIVKASLRFLSYTMLRASTLVTLKWSYVDFETQTLTIPRSEMKVKDDNLNDFTLPLPHQAMRILEEIKPFTGHSEYIFSIEGKPINKESGNKALRLLGYNDPAKGIKQTLHSFRGTYRSLVETHQDQHGATYEVKEAVLDHQVGSKVERAYTHKSDYVKQMRELLQWYADYLEGVKRG